jgi:CheY-like chemotaxis protein
MRQSPAVLVVDDEHGVRETAVAVFESLGHTVFEAWNGEAALLMLRSRPEIAILFTDVRMPGMGGISLAAAARKIRPKLKVIVTSGYTGDEVELDKTVTFLRKPWRVADVEEALNRDG